MKFWRIASIAASFSRHRAFASACALVAILPVLVIACGATSLRKTPLGLPEAPPQESAERIALGRKLFFDRRLSANNTLSCGMCHIPSQAFASTQTATAVGFLGQSLRRNAPSLLNVVYQRTLFHDGHESDLAQQAWLPMIASDEMANLSMGQVLARIRALPDYNGEFEKAFDGQGPSMQTVGDAIAAYEKTLLSGNSRFDRWRFGGEKNAITRQEQRGYELFVGKAGCVTCHAMEEHTALFTDHEFHDTGIGYHATIAPDNKTYEVQLAPGTFIKMHADQLRSVSEPLKNDLGRFEVTLNPHERWAYKTPSLRNVALTSPYMHDGSLPSLEDVLDYYDRGGIPHDGQAQEIHPLGLSAAEKSDIIAFLKTLSGDAAEREAMAAADTPNRYSPIPITAEDGAR
ncbi:cytochrome c peroxidase [Hyphomicrobium sp. 1Nfss2.1]|uniref:cytochrome-c peroxidase n=1 Tax=Hyphomicrobium sp. 1Nfss2.1 TaxID=3413936 RepID=UPI003C7CFEA6